MFKPSLILSSALLCASNLHAAGINLNTTITELDNVNISGKLSSTNTTSASTGLVVSEQIEQRPISRAGEILETVPGLIVTQHSGEGKANQYFLRGFNLDHGTDMATFIDGMPVNMRSHGHGQGYTDINFIIPETIDSLEYKKGAFHASEGDFSNAGAVRLHTKEQLKNNTAEMSIGEYNYKRALLLAGNEHTVLALDSSEYDGPWESEQEQKKYSGLIKHTIGDAINGANLTVMGYKNNWNATDQVPQRLIGQDGFGRYSNLDDDSGGNTHRYSLSATAWKNFSGNTLNASLYAIDYQLELFSNYTYATDQINGDELRQYDDRTIIGGAVDYELIPNRFGTWTLGADLRNDIIGDVSISKSQDRIITQRVQQHSINELSLATYIQNNYQWTDNFASEFGLRFTHLQARSKNKLTNTQADSDDSIISPKVNFSYAMDNTHFFLNYGQGFHSNDARGFTEGDVPALVKSESADIGVQIQFASNLQLSTSLWWLTLDSELIFVGDDGTTEASDQSERTGIESSLFWSPAPWIIIDGDLAISRARIQPDNAPEQYIPGAIENIASLGVTIMDLGPVEAGLRIRHFGSFALNEDNSQRSDAVTSVNLQGSYQITPSVSTAVDLINITDTKSNDITYLYESQLANESSPVEDVHFHPVEPRMVRMSLKYQF
jgi:hypothetical protein